MTTGLPPTFARAATAAQVVSLRTSPWGSGHAPPSPPARSTTATSITAWMVRTIMVATTGFALFDLYLLASSVHH